MKRSVPSVVRRLARISKLIRVELTEQPSRDLVDHTCQMTRSPSATQCLVPDSAFARIAPRITRVDDPFIEMSLIAIRGEVDDDTIGQLHSVLGDVNAGRYVHLDLGDALISTGRSMRQLEDTADDLERRDVVLRVVGLDPQHPLLARSL